MVGLAWLSGDEPSLSDLASAAFQEAYSLPREFAYILKRCGWKSMEDFGSASQFRIQITVVDDSVYIDRETL